MGEVAWQPVGLGFSADRRRDPDTALAVAINQKRGIGRRIHRERDFRGPVGVAAAPERFAIYTRTE